jgi:hypothetical protein
MAKRESANISRRMKADIARRQARGVVNSGGRGGRLFGFRSDGIAHVPHEAAIVRETIGRVLAGEGIRHIAADLRARGITTTAGKPMHPLAVRRMVASPRYAGLMPDAASAASWEPVVSREDWEAANAVMASRAGPLAPGHHARRYLLSGIARCGVCGAPMQVLPAYTKKTGEHIAARYGCLTPPCRKVFRKLEHLDTYVTVRTVLKLLLGRLESVDTRLAQLRELTAADAAARIAGTHAGITEDEFSDLPLSVRRTLVAALFTVTVLPASKRGPGFNTADVRLGAP